MKIGIISDSHNGRKSVLKAVEVFNEREVDYVLHAGDIDSPATAKDFAGLTKAKFIAVFGNCDNNKPLLAKVIDDFGGQIHEGVYTGDIGGKKIFMTHSLNSPDDIASSGEYDLVIYGHTHNRDIHKIGDTLVINPGVSAGRFMSKPSVVVLQLDDMSIEQISLK